MDNGPTTPRTVSIACWTLILLSTVLSIVRLLHAEPLVSANDRSRWCTVRSLVELGTYQIDQAREVRGWDSIDIVRHDGHFYSTKPPLLPTIVAGLYWTVRETIGWTFGKELNASTRLILLVLNILPMVIALALLTRLIRETSTSAFTAIFVTATAAFGTLLLPFLTVLNNHTVAATALVFALLPLVRILQGHTEPWRYAMVGFWAAFTCCNDLPAAAFGLASFVILFRTSPKRTWLYFVPAALIPLSAFFYTNYLATGGWKPFYAYYGTEKYLFVHEGVPSYWMQPRGVDANRDGFGTYLLHCLLGHHGLLSLTPVLLFTLFGWATLVRRDKKHQAANDENDAPRNINTAIRPIHWTGAALSLIVFTFFMTKTENYNYGGVSIALRWMLWLTPFWLLAIVPALDASAQITRPFIKTSLQAFACLTLAVSTFSAWYPLNGPWKQPWLFTLMEEAGWIDYSDPQPVFERDVRTWISQLPTGDIQSDYWIELEGREIDGSLSILRIEDLGPALYDDRPARGIRFSKQERGQDEWIREVAVDVAAFEAGATPAEFVINSDVTRSGEEWERIQTLFSGIPGAPRYVLIHERYLKVPLRTDAFRTDRAYAQLIIRNDDQTAPHRFRREIWLTEEVPFGVVQILDQVTDSDGVVISRQNFPAVRAGTILPTTSE